MKVYWLGYGGNSWMAEELRPIIEELGLSLITIHEHENADIKWDKDTWLDHLKKADIVISPANYKVQPAKSANRVTQAMSLGKPVICSPMPSYIDVAKKHPGSFLVADTPEEWKEKLKILKENPAYRKELSEKALAAAQDYSIDAIGNKWVELFKECKVEKSDDVVDIVIPTYKNLRGLKLCLESIRACTQVNYKIIIVNNGTDEELHKYLNTISTVQPYLQQNEIVYIKKERLNFAQAVNTGIKAGNSKYVMILNDDVIVSKGWLQNMVDVCTDKIGAVGLFSNCDKGWLHDYTVNIGGVTLLPGTNTYAEIEPIIPDIYNFKSVIPDIKEQEWVAFYATLIPRKVVDEVGYLDEEFTNSGEDVDYCKRIRRMGYNIVQTYKSFVFHFGAVSRKILEEEDHGSYHRSNDSTQAYLKTKYEKKTVVIYSGPSWERWSYKNEKEGGIGGSEIWQIMLSRELTELGYRVINFCDTPEPEMESEGVQYLHYSKFPEFVDMNYIDYFITSRTTNSLKLPIRAGKIFVQIHDVWLLSQDKECNDKVDKYCVLSEWHKNFASDHHNIPLEKMHIVANGIDFDRFDNIEIEKSPFRLHWSSSWDRGLDNVLYLFPFIKEKVPESELHVYYGSNTWKASCLKNGDKESLKKIEGIEKLMEMDGVFNHGRVNQEELAIAEKQASLLLYPTWFSETFFITGVECQRAGMPVLAHNYAGLQTTLRNSAILLGDGKDAWWPYSEEGRQAFLDEAVSLLTDREKWARWVEIGRENTENYSWSKVALMWDGLFKNEG